MQVLGDGYDVLNEKIDAASYTYKHMETLGDLVPYYQETYKGRGQEGWRQHMLHDLSGITGKSEKYLGRRLDPSRLYKKDRETGKPVKGDIREPKDKQVQAQYRKLGEQLPMKKEPKDLAGKRAKVTFRGTVCIPSGKDKKGQPKQNCREKNFTRTLDRTQTHEMKYGSFDPIFDAYQINPDVIGSIEVYDLQVEFI